MPIRAEGLIAFSDGDITGRYRVMPYIANSTWIFKEGRSIRWLHMTVHVQLPEPFGAKSCGNLTEAPAGWLRVLRRNDGFYILGPAEIHRVERTVPTSWCRFRRIALRCGRTL